MIRSHILVPHQLHCTYSWSLLREGIISENLWWRSWLQLRKLFPFQVFTDRNFIFGRLRNSEHGRPCSWAQSPGALHRHCHDRISYSRFYYPAIAVFCLRSEESCEIHLWNSASHGYSSWNCFKVDLSILVFPYQQDQAKNIKFVRPTFEGECSFLDLF